MPVKALDHVNIVTADLVASARFYGELLELQPDPGLPEAMKGTAVWLCDERGQPIIHLNSLSQFRAFDRDFPAGAETGAIHHVALACAGYDATIARLTARGSAYETNDVPHIGLRQIFTRDPHNVLLELNFYAD